MKKIIKYWAPVMAWASLIFLLSSRPTGNATEIILTDFIIKKTAHMVEYGVLAGLIYRGLTNSGVDKGAAGTMAIMMAFFYGLSDEWHQSFTPGRMPRAYDVVFDTIGATGVIYLIWKQLPKAPKRLRDWAKSWEIV